jgi:hypothetical protein
MSGENYFNFGKSLSDETKAGLRPVVLIKPPARAALMNIYHIGKKSSVSKSSGPAHIAVGLSSGICIL